MIQGFEQNKYLRILALSGHKAFVRTLIPWNLGGFKYPMLYNLTVFQTQGKVVADQPIFKQVFKVVPISMSRLLPCGGGADSFLQS